MDQRHLYYHAQVLQLVYTTVVTIRMLVLPVQVPLYWTVSIQNNSFQSHFYLFSFSCFASVSSIKVMQVYANVMLAMLHINIRCEQNLQPHAQTWSTHKRSPNLQMHTLLALCMLLIKSRDSSLSSFIHCSLKHWKSVSRGVGSTAAWAAMAATLIRPRTCTIKFELAISATFKQQCKFTFINGVKFWQCECWSRMLT